MNHSDSSEISRRRALSTIACLGVGSTYMVTPQIANAQDTPRVSDEILFRLGDIINNLEIELGEVSLSESPDLSDIEPAVRENTLSVLSSVSDDQVLQLVAPENLRLAYEMRSREISLDRPDPELITDPRDISADSGESCSAVVYSIILETLGIDESLRSRFSNAMDRRNLSNLIEQIGREARERRWARVTVLLKNFFRKLTSPTSIATLERALGRRAVNRILATIASRLVPILGWAILAVALTNSLYRNWDRLEECSF